ncbi:MAG TPA: TetR/AcrR family transcriptional regulator [Acidimicrobiales bacterium]|nr:TetR/AcrR family transcriptional regulator [Acidimicrobiales bacterium]
MQAASGTAGAGVDTRRRVLGAAMSAFAARGYEATSLDSLAAELGLRKQTILYYFNSKETLLEAVIDDAGHQLVAAVEQALGRAGPGLARVDAVVRSVFAVAARHPELLGLLREVSRLGPPPATRLRRRLEPFIDRATAFLDAEMAAGTVRRQDARLLLLTAYSTVIGVATEVEVLRAVGVEPTARSLVRRRSELLDFLHSALAGGAPVGLGPAPES